MSKKSSEILDDPMEVEGEPQKNVEHHGDDSCLLIPQLPRDTSIHCLLQLSRSHYSAIAALNRTFRSLIKTGELYQLRREMGIIEHWIYFSCDVLKWEAFDPNHDRLMQLPEMSSNTCFMLSDKESLAVGTELIVFGREITGPAIYKYSITTNSWLKGMNMNTPRCLFGSASLGEIAILAGGCDQFGNILSSSELYNSDTGTWETLPNMNTPRKMCSAVFMDGKFYVLGGVGVDKTTQLTCGEEFDLKTRKWRKIPYMCPPRNGGDGANSVVDKNAWVTIGNLPSRVTSLNGWGMAFRSCGDNLVVIGGPSLHGGMATEVNAWAVDDGTPEWNLLAIIQSGSFVFNCAVMGC
ncbi:hypothetical protein P8452_71947 [Trifolium repens]|nr:hypothetical protein P8452_71947 [Trifolium repens]